VRWTPRAFLREVVENQSLDGGPITARPLRTAAVGSMGRCATRALRETSLLILAGEPAKANYVASEDRDKFAASAHLALRPLANQHNGRDAADDFDKNALR
jgi:hypothetical protein